MSMNYGKILMSLGLIAFVGAVAIGGTQAMYSDEESSTGNTFSAGSIDLTVGNESYVTNAAGEFVESPSTTWEPDELTGRLFFNFYDLKPGDYGEDTITLEVTSNPSWMCADLEVTDNRENGINEPESAVDTTPDEGELAEALQFFFWSDDGDNVYEEGEIPLIEGNDGIVTADRWIVDGEDGWATSYPLADSTVNWFADEPFAEPQPVDPNTEYHIGKFWCFGDLTPTPADQDNETDEGPLDRLVDGEPTTGFSCDGGDLGNETQTDEVIGNLTFRAEQARHNEDFTCSFEGAPDQLVAGANLDLYGAPEQCDITVGDDADYETIAEAIGVAEEGDVICVEDGTYDEGNLVVDVPGVTIASLSAPTDTATVEGDFRIEAADVTITGFAVVPDSRAFYLAPGSAGAAINFNDVDGTASAGSNLRGVVVESGIDATNVEIEHNVFANLTTGIYTNTHTGSILIKSNDFADNVAGIGGFNGASVVNNEFTHTTTGSEAIGLDESFEDNPGIINYNNFLNGTAINTYDTSFAGTLPASVVINAQNNYFDVSAAAQTDDSAGGTIDADPDAASAF